MLDSVRRHRGLTVAIGVMVVLLAAAAAYLITPTYFPILPH